MFLKPKKQVFFILFMVCTLACCQSSWGQHRKKAFQNLSLQEKCWVYLHPFKAKRAYQISKKVEAVVDSLAQTKTLEKKRVGNRLDAFKHSLWMWSLADEIGGNAAKSLGKAHEKGNYSQYKKRKSEDGMLPDKPSSDMDTHNNKVGIALYKKHKKQKRSFSDKITLVMAEVVKGSTVMLAQNPQGEFLDNHGKVIPPEVLKGTWENRKCLISTQINNPQENNHLNLLHLLEQNKEQ